MRVPQVKVILAIGAAFLSYIPLARAAPALTGAEASMPQPVVARDGGDVEGGFYNLCANRKSLSSVETPSSSFSLPFFR